jgi:hypothetical protein
LCDVGLGRLLVRAAKALRSSKVRILARSTRKAAAAHGIDAAVSAIRGFANSARFAGHYRRATAI